MAKAPDTRKAVRQFFEYNTDPDSEIWWEKPGYWASAILGVIAAINATPVAGLLTAGVSAGGVYWAIQTTRRRKKDLIAKEFGQLAAKTRAIQGQDSLKAFLRIFERSQLERQELRALERRYRFEKEKQLFEEESLAEKLGDLFNKSIRLYSRGDFNNNLVRKVRWKSGGTETFYNPLRVVALFLTPQELVICDCDVDSVDGDLREKIVRIMLTDIVSVGFTSQRVRLPLKKNDVLRTAKDLNLDKDEIDKIEKTFERSGDGQSEYVQEEMTSKLEITRTDGGTLQFPIKSEIVFGRHASALDQGVALTDDEVTVDRMVNELNRVVKGSRLVARQ